MDCGSYPDDLSPSAVQNVTLTEKENDFMEAVSEFPGASIDELKNILVWSRGTTRYYRNKLVRKGVLICDRERQPHTHYPRVLSRGKSDFENMRVKNFIDHPKRRKVLLVLKEFRGTKERPGGWTAPNAVANQIGSSHEFVLKTACRLKEFGLVESRVTGMRTEFRATERSLDDSPCSDQVIQSISGGTRSQG